MPYAVSYRGEGGGGGGKRGNTTLELLRGGGYSSHCEILNKSMNKISVMDFARYKYKSFRFLNIRSEVGRLGL